MNSSPGPRFPLAKTLVLAAALFAGQASAAAIHGALFTTDAAANVNVNQYPTKSDVYLSGGPPPSAPCTSAGMDDGVYVYKITNPSGTVDLSGDDISHREFTVSGGVIVSANDHATVPGNCPGAVGVQMVPYDDTPNNGGVYKAWVTRKSDYIANGGFSPGSTKTDNFRVKIPSVTPETADLNVYKFYDFNANGVWDSTEMPLFGWAMQVTNGNGFDQTKLTVSPDGIASWTGLSLADNPYAVTEGTAGGTWHQSASIVNGVPTLLSPENPVTGLVLEANQTTEVDFGNYCTCGSGGRTLGFWSNQNGQLKLADGSTGMNYEFGILNALNLRTASGGNFSLNLANAQSTNYTTFRNWLLNATATNMAYMLSAQLAAMRLDVEAGYVNPNNYYKPFGGTIAELITTANTLLSTGVCGATCNTTAASQLRTDQQTVKNYLDQLNNGATVILAHPCKYKFYLPVY